MTLSKLQIETLYDWNNYKIYIITSTFLLLEFFANFFPSSSFLSFPSAFLPPNFSSLQSPFIAFDINFINLYIRQHEEKKQHQQKALPIHLSIPRQKQLILPVFKHKLL